MLFPQILKILILSLCSHQLSIFKNENVASGIVIRMLWKVISTLTSAYGNAMVEQGITVGLNHVS